MSVQIQGGSGNVLDVNKRGEVLAAASVTPEIIKTGLADGDSYIWCSTDINVAAAGTLLAVRNDSSTQRLVITRIIIVGGDVTSRYEIHRVNVAYGATGTDVVGMNLANRGAIADVAADANETQNAQVAANVFMEAALTTKASVDLRVGIVLGYGDALVCDQVAESTAGSCTFFGYFVENN